MIMGFLRRALMGFAFTSTVMALDMSERNLPSAPPSSSPPPVRQDNDWTLAKWWSGESAIPSTALRSGLADTGVDFSGSYVADFLGSVSGGESRAFAYTHTLEGQLVFDLEKLTRWQGASITWSFADNAGSNLQNAVGNIFTPSNLFGPNTFYFGEFYLTQKLFEEAVQIKLGQLCAKEDFGSSPIYGNYLNSAFNGNPLVPFGTYPMSSFPVSSWGAFVHGDLKMDDALLNFYGQAGIYQVSDRMGIYAYKGMDYSIRSNDGTMALWEVGWSPSFFSTPSESFPPAGKSVAGEKSAVATVENRGYPGHYKFGGFLSNWSYATTSGASEPTTYGFYFTADQQVTMEKDNPAEGLVLWAALGWTPQESLNEIPVGISGGLQYTGLIPQRSEDIALLGIGYAMVARAGAGFEDRINERLDFTGSGYEIAIEGTYVI
ncbi:MAG: carbohydrate porin, partial [Deltaproteobacteria bacterium]